MAPALVFAPQERQQGAAVHVRGRGEAGHVQEGGGKVHVQRDVGEAGGEMGRAILFYMVI